MNKYEIPDMNIIYLEVEDIITESAGGTGSTLQSSDSAAGWDGSSTDSLGW